MTRSKAKEQMELTKVQLIVDNVIKMTNYTFFSQNNFIFNLSASSIVIILLELIAPKSLWQKAVLAKG